MGQATVNLERFAHLGPPPDRQRGQVAHAEGGSELVDAHGVQPAPGLGTTSVAAPGVRPLQHRQQVRLPDICRQLDHATKPRMGDQAATRHRGGVSRSHPRV